MFTRSPVSARGTRTGGIRPGANVGEGSTVGQYWQYKAETPGP